MAITVKDASNATNTVWTRQADSQDIQGVDPRPASGIQDNRKTVTTAGTRDTLAGSATPCWEVTITAEIDNTGYVVVGGSTVVAALATRRGTPLAAGESVTVKIDDLQKVYLDVTVSGDGVTFTYLTAPVDPT